MPQGRFEPTKFRPRKKKLDDLLDPDCLDDDTRRMLMNEIMHPPPAYLGPPTQRESSPASPPESSSSLSFTERLRQAGGSGGGTNPSSPPPVARSEPYSSGTAPPYPSMLRSKVQSGSEDVMASMAARLRDLEAKHHAYQCENKELHDKYRTLNDIYQKTRRQNEVNENTIVTLYEEKEELEGEVKAMRAFIQASGLTYVKQGETTKVKSEADSVTGESNSKEKKPAQKASSALYDGDVSLSGTLMDEETAEAVLAASGPRRFPNSAMAQGAQLYSSRQQLVMKASQHPQPSPSSSSGGGGEGNGGSGSRTAPDVDHLKKNAEVLSHYVGFSTVVSDGKRGAIRQRDVVKVVVYQNGICVNSGMFRPYGWPLCDDFLQDLLEGYYPYEFKEKYPDGFPIEITDKHEEVCDTATATSSGGSKTMKKAWEQDGGYEPVSRDEFLKRIPEKRITPSGRVVNTRADIAALIGAPGNGTGKEGEGGHHVTRSEKLYEEKLKKTSSQPVPPSSASGPKARPEGATAQSPQESSSTAGEALVPIMIRLPAGGQLTMKLAATDTITTLHNEFVVAAPSFQKQRIEFCQAFPPVTFSDHSKTLKDYGLTRSSTLMVKRITA